MVIVIIETHLLLNTLLLYLHIDVNECMDDSSYCEHKCTNTIGDFFCDCYDGYILFNDSQCRREYKLWVSIHNPREMTNGPSQSILPIRNRSG